MSREEKITLYSVIIIAGSKVKLQSPGWYERRQLSANGDV